jgi:hypothetical protein
MKAVLKIYLLVLFYLIPVSVWCQVKDTSFVELSGIVKDADSKDPVVFAHVSLIGTNIGTITNTDGRFLLKIPATHSMGQIAVSSLGYKNLIISIPELKRIGNEIKLEMMRFIIQEIVVRNYEPIDLIRAVKKRIPLNYGQTPAMFTAFYRETIKKGRSYVALSEAVFDVYKSPYGEPGDDDRIRIYKGRKSQDVEKMDTVLFKLQGGPNSLFILDVAKHFDMLFPDEYLNYYDFHYLDQESMQDRQVYVIGFNQKPNVALPLYEGKIYIDVQTLAITGLQFSISPYGLAYAPSIMILKKPAGMKVDIPGASYTVKYIFKNNRWFLSYARSEANFRCKWNRKLFRSIYTTVSEMAITDMDLKNIVKFRLRETARPHEIFSEIVSDFDDPSFWGDYNIIRPELSIEEATKKLSKKLQRK